MRNIFTKNGEAYCKTKLFNNDHNILSKQCIEKGRDINDVFNIAIENALADIKNKGYIERTPVLVKKTDDTLIERNLDITTDNYNNLRKVCKKSGFTLSELVNTIVPNYMFKALN